MTPHNKPRRDLALPRVSRLQPRRRHSGQRPSRPRASPPTTRRRKTRTRAGVAAAPGIGLGGSAGSPRACRMALTTLGAITTAITWRRDPPPGHSKISTANTLDSNMAQLGARPLTATLSRARLGDLVTHRRPGNDLGPPRRPWGEHPVEIASGGRWVGALAPPVSRSRSPARIG